MFTKRTQEILVDAMDANDYILGRISGIVYAMTGRPEKEYPWVWSGKQDFTLRFDAVEEQSHAIHHCLNKKYPKAYMGMREVR